MPSSVIKIVVRTFSCCTYPVTPVTSTRSPVSKGRCMLRKMLARKFSVMSRKAMPTARPIRPVPPTTVRASCVKPATRRMM